MFLSTCITLMYRIVFCTVSISKDYDNDSIIITFRDCQVHFLNIYLRRKEILSIFFHHFVDLPAKDELLLDYFWDISRDWERLQRTTTWLCIGDWYHTCWWKCCLLGIFQFFNISTTKISNPLLIKTTSLHKVSVFWWKPVLKYILYNWFVGV